ncbi:hypothetical protein ABBQ38_001374 [Trebouxia sp. C0009 RCD-2024]
MAFSLDVFQVIFFVLLLGIGSEIALYLWCYQAPSFKSINESIVKLSRKANALKGTPQYYKQRQNKKNDRFEAGLKKEATKELAVLKVKQSIVAAVGAIGMYWILTSLYLDRVVAKLPFDAHWTVAKIAHRGLTLPKANDCAVVGVLPNNT